MFLVVSRMSLTLLRTTRAPHSCRYAHARSFGTNVESYLFRHFSYLRMITESYPKISNLHAHLSANGPMNIHSCSLLPANQRMHVRCRKEACGKEGHIPGIRYPSLNRPYTFQYSQVDKSGYSPLLRPYPL